MSTSQVGAQKRLFVTIALVRSLWTCDTQKVEVPPSLNAMEGTGSEAREREAAGERQGKEGKGRKGNEIQGLEASQFSSFHRACVSSVGCSNAGEANSVLLRLPSQSLLRAQGCPSNAGGTKRGRLRDLAQGRDRRDCGGEARESFRRPAGLPR